MRVIARVTNCEADHQVELETDGVTRKLDIPAKLSGRGSSASGGELLVLALATCYCNDIFREAGKLGIEVQAVEVEAEAIFEAAGQPASSISYRARVTADAPDEAVEALIRHTDSVAEVHLTIRRGIEVSLSS